MDAESTKRRFRVHGWTILWATAILLALALLNVEHRGWPIRFVRKIEFLPERLLANLVILGVPAVLSVCFVESLCRRLLSPPRKADYLAVVAVVVGCSFATRAESRLVVSLLVTARVAFLVAVVFAWFMAARLITRLKLRRSEPEPRPLMPTSTSRRFSLAIQSLGLLLLLAAWCLTSVVQLPLVPFNHASGNSFGWPVAFVNGITYDGHFAGASFHGLNLFRPGWLVFDFNSTLTNLALWVAVGYGVIRWLAPAADSISIRLQLPQLLALTAAIATVYQILTNWTITLRLVAAVVVLVVFLLGATGLAASYFRDVTSLLLRRRHERESRWGREFRVTRVAVGTLIIALGASSLVERGDHTLGSINKATGYRFAAWLKSVGPGVQPLGIGGQPTDFDPELDTIDWITGIQFEGVTVDDLSGLRGLPSLQKIRAIDCKLRDLSTLASLPLLGEVTLQKCSVKDWSTLGTATGISRLDLTGSDISDLRPIANLALAELNIDETPVADLRPLSGMKSLYWLALNDSRVRDLSPLSGLNGLAILELKGTPIKSLNALSGLKGLTILNIEQTQVDDLRPLKGCPKLGTLNMRGTPARSLRGLKMLGNLTFLQLEGSKVNELADLPANLGDLRLAGVDTQDYSQLASLRQLYRLDLTRTSIRDLSCLSGLRELIELRLAGTRAIDLKPLSKLSNLVVLDLTGVVVDDLTPLAGLPALQDLRLAGSNVRDLSPLVGLKKLESLDVGQTQVDDVSVLRTLESLMTLRLRDTAIADISCLVTLEDLVELNLSNTKVRDVSSLQQMHSLQRVNLSMTGVTDIKPLSNLLTLNRLDLSATAVMRTEALHKLYNLRELHLSKTSVSRTAVARLRKALPNCKVLR